MNLHIPTALISFAGLMLAAIGLAMALLCLVCGKWRGAAIWSSACAAGVWGFAATIGSVL